MRSLRCKPLFIPQPGFDASNFRVVVASLVRYPYENEACDPAYQDRVQKALDERGTGVEIKIEKETWRVESAEGQYSESEVCRVAMTCPAPSSGVHPLSNPLPHRSSRE